MLSKIELEFAQITYRWKIHSDLFNDNNKVNLLNRCSGKVFSVLQSLLVFDTLAALCRLHDPAESGYSKEENNSIANQYKKQKHKLSELEIETIDSLLMSLTEKMTNIKILRNKAISHNDLAVAESLITLPNVTYGEIDDVLATMNTILNKIFRSNGDYSPTIMFGAGTTKLFRVLEAGEKILYS